MNITEIDHRRSKPATFTHEGHTFEAHVRECYPHETGYTWDARALMSDPQPVSFMVLIHREEAPTREAAIEVGIADLREQITEWATATLDSAKRIEAARAGR